MSATFVTHSRIIPDKDIIDEVVCGDCLDILPTIPDASIDAVITDPPYPHIKRDYGYWTEAEWWEMVVEGVIPQVRRVLKPTGSAVFILQSNYEKVGNMRGWLWEFMAWVCREWNMVQDVWWWNYMALPTAGTPENLLRCSVKACVWGGESDCYRNKDTVLWETSKAVQQKIAKRMNRRSLHRLNGKTVNNNRMLEIIASNDGVTPFNLLPFGIYAQNKGHGASTPVELIDWWTRYIVPPGGTVLDPFFGVGTMALAAIKNKCHFIGIEKEAHYCETARERIAQAREEYAQTEMTL